MSLPRIALTIGDPAGVGPEICLKTSQESSVLDSCVPVLFGDQSVLKAVGEKLNLPVPKTIISVDQLDKLDHLEEPAVLDFSSLHYSDFETGKVNAATGKASFAYFDKAIALAIESRIDGIVTGPIHKKAIHAAGHFYPGHTEILADRTRTDDYCMMLTSEIISCSFVTTHVGLHEVPELITTESVLNCIRLTHQALTKIRGRSIKLVCCGLNPHAGEEGLFGRQEEEQFIIPALQQARTEGIDIEGPLPADTAFIQSKRATTDGYICMYHDQGSIPLKALSFDEAVNITLGLPIIRTSVDHGTACDIAWQGIAIHQSMIEATLLAARLV